MTLVLGEVVDGGEAYLVPDVEVGDQRVASGCAGAVVRHQWYVREVCCVVHGEWTEGCGVETRKVEVEKVLSLT